LRDEPCDTIFDRHAHIFRIEGDDRSRRGHRFEHRDADEALDDAGLDVHV